MVDDLKKKILAEANRRRGIVKQKGPGRPKGEYIKPAPIMPADQAADLKNLLIARLNRRLESLNLYVPMPLQRQFHEANASERLIRGSNRSGKTTAAAKEVAAIVTGRDPRSPAQNGIAYLVGKDGKEVANVMYKLLFRAGAFKIIRDEHTNEWRAYNPTNKLDAMRSKEAKAAPPLIPQRFIKSVSWENKKGNLPSVITLTNGWELHFFSSNGKPPHGSQIDLTWFDEEILDSGWYGECSARMVDRNGRFIWSATPQAGTAQLYELHERAERESRLPREQRKIEEFVALLADNQHLTQAQKEDFASKLSEEDIMVRIHGEFAAHGFRVYPEFSIERHVCQDFSIPYDWTIYCAIDPGRQVCGVLFAAVPSAEHGDFIYLMDELYIHQCNAQIFGKEMRRKTSGRTVQAFIIDHQEGRKADTGSGRTVEMQYGEALEQNGVTCIRTGTEFTWGAADPLGGIEAVRSWLAPGPGGRAPRLRVLDGRCPNFVWEMKRYWYEKGPDKRPTDKPRDRGPVHLCACIRYLAQDDCVWVPPADKKPRASEVWKAAHNLMHPKGQHGALNLGPGSSLTVSIGGIS